MAKRTAVTTNVVDVDVDFDSLFANHHTVAKRDWSGIAIHVMHNLLALLLAVAVLWIPVMQAYNAQREQAAVDGISGTVNNWPPERIRSETLAARQYNVAIAQSGQSDMGEFQDPFSGDGDNDEDQSKDDGIEDELVPPILRNGTYRRLLNVQDGAMGVVEIPRISVKLPIFHGTSDEVLAKGVGHLRGTSLPVGGKSTNAVLSGHRGLPTALLFTRLDRLRKGNVFFVSVLQQRMAYKIVAIHIIDPSDTHLYKVVPGKDLVTLMTCTPYGINTSRLILTGQRTTLSDAKSDQRDGLLQAVLTMVAVLLAGVAVLRVKYYHHRIFPWPWHANGIFRGRSAGAGKHTN
ncbi:class C sortase [Bifidobacterium sp. ESL0764]|uniref:class C sortase n=1 Tax=Bifidobacterium sp. ESL0764 TaxID=2983228 RepID=UPI0023F7E4AF|nr:class C sortase [Bifidobacterium sp. ESL0764]WEV65766.1 class C sortase [Bifidobacterium sp. ESL0764]